MYAGPEALLSSGTLTRGSSVSVVVAKLALVQGFSRSPFPSRQCLRSLTGRFVRLSLQQDVRLLLEYEERSSGGRLVLLCRAEICQKVSPAVASFDRDSEGQGQLSGQFVG